MAHRAQGHIGAAIASILPVQQIQSLARRLGVVVRQRKVDVGWLVQALVLGFSIDRSRTLNAFRQAYQVLSGQSLARSSFHVRFTAELVELLRRLVARALARGTVAPAGRGAFEAFAEVLALDSCILRLHDSLRSHYQGVWQPAAVKLTMVSNVIGRSVRALQLNPGRTADVHLFDLKLCQMGRLFIFDLGFYQTLLFSRIHRRGAFFLSRLKRHANSTIVRSHHPQLRHLEGSKLRQALTQVSGLIAEFDVELRYTDCQVSWSEQSVIFRVVCIRTETNAPWHGYITNAPPHMLDASHIASVYAARWEIELLFRELQSNYRIDQHPSANLHVTEALLYAAVLSLLVSRKLHRLVQRITGLHNDRLSVDRWARIFTCHTAQLINLLAHPSPPAQRRLLALLCHEAPDPNRQRKRPLLPLRAQFGCAFA